MYNEAAKADIQEKELGRIVADEMLKIVPDNANTETIRNTILDNFNRISEKHGYDKYDDGTALVLLGCRLHLDPSDTAKLYRQLEQQLAERSSDN